MKRAFGVRFVSRWTAAYYFILTRKEADRHAPEPMRCYYKSNREAWYTIVPGETRLEDYIPLLEAAYARAGGFGVR